MSSEDETPVKTEDQVKSTPQKKKTPRAKKSSAPSNEDQVKNTPQKTKASKAKKAAPSGYGSYPSMILEAIKELDDRQGSSRKAIRKFIVAKYAPRNVSTYLAKNLTRMLENGELQHPKKGPGKYIIVEKEQKSKPKTGRGRPKKTTKATPKKKKAAGRPKKTDKATPKKKTAVSRTKKTVTPKKKKVAASPQKAAEPSPKKAKSGRGGDSPQKTVDASPKKAVTPKAQKVPGRGRGRPKKK